MRRSVAGHIGRELFVRRTCVFLGDFLYDNLCLGLTGISSSCSFGSGGCIGSALFFACVFGGLLSCQISGDLFFCPLFSSRVGLCLGCRRCAGWNLGFSLGFCACIVLLGSVRISSRCGLNRVCSSLLGLCFGSSICLGIRRNLCGYRVFTLGLSLGFGCGGFFCLRSLGVSSSLSFSGLLFSGLCSSCGFGVSSGLGFSGFCFGLRGSGLCVGGGLLFSSLLSFSSRVSFSFGCGGSLLFCGVYSFSSGFCIGLGLSLRLGFCFQTERLGQTTVSAQGHHLILVSDNAAVRQDAWKNSLFPLAHAAFSCLGKTTCGQSKRQTHGQ